MKPPAPKCPNSQAHGRRAWRLGIWVLGCLVCCAAAQQPAPHIGYVYPAGGRQGTTFQVTLGGQFLNGVSNVFISGAGAEGAVVDFSKPMNQGEFNRLRDRLRELQDKRQAALREARRGGAGHSTTNTWTAADEKVMAEIRDKIVKNPPNRSAAPALAENVIVHITLATNAEPGEREIRLGGLLGLSNPLKFCIGMLPEFSQPAAKAPNPDLDRFLERLGKTPTKETARTEMRIVLPAAVNGQITPGGVDRFRFHARKGQQLVAVVTARDLIPYLADAVPGWFQATLALYDAKGKELAYLDDFRFHPDPVLCYKIPRDGDYVLEIKDAIYRGREDFVYRITLGELPFITSIFPLGGRVGQRTEVALTGWNLPQESLIVEPQGNARPAVLLSVGEPPQISNLVPFAADTLPEFQENESNNSPAQAQKIVLPAIINGRIGQPGDKDVFQFEGRAGDELVAEVYARRVDSPIDSVLRLTDGSGQPLAFNDDWEDKGSGLSTHHADSYLRTKLPADGTYFVQLFDAQHHGGDEYAYRLRLSAPRPDFELRVVPCSVNAPAGGSVPLTVYALRKDGFTNEIELALKDPSPGFTLSGGLVPAGQDQVRITLTPPPASVKRPIEIRLEGMATACGERVRRTAVPAEDMMQAFAYRHLVPAKQMLVTVSGRPLSRSAKILGDVPVKIPLGGSARVQIGAPAAIDRFQFELNEPPAGIAIRKISPNDQGAELVLQSDASKMKAGLKGNLIVNVFAKQAVFAGKGQKPANQRRVAAGTLPAIPFEVVGQAALTGP
jgi:hypothetical protein